MLVIKTVLCDLLDIKYPFFQGGMAWIAGGRLAGAVSKAGALGVIGTGGGDIKWIREQIDIAYTITSQPFAVNLMLARPDIDEIIRTVIEKKVPVVTTGGGNPGKYIPVFKEAGIKVIPVVASVALAKRLARLGADAIIAEGMESGGHIGEMSTMTIVPMVVDAVDIPVIAAGGIFDGRGIVAALALGAQGVQVGTRFICAQECEVHPEYQQRVIKARDRDTVVCGTVTGHPVRAIRNQFTRLYLEKERSGASREELEQLGRGRYPAAAIKGDIVEGTVLAGQACAAVNKVESAADIVNSMMREAAKVKERLGGK